MKRMRYSLKTLVIFAGEMDSCWPWVRNLLRAAPRYCVARGLSGDLDGWGGD